MNNSFLQKDKPTLREILLVFLTIGSLSFGGGVVAYLRVFCVTRYQWLSESEFMNALGLGQTFPGLIAINLSVIIGDNLKGVAGAIVALIGMIAPATMFLLTVGKLALLYKNSHYLSVFLSAIAASAVGFVFFITADIAQKNLQSWRDITILILTFCAIALCHISLLFVLPVLVPMSLWLHYEK